MQQLISRHNFKVGMIDIEDITCISLDRRDNSRITSSSSSESLENRSRLGLITLKAGIQITIGIIRGSSFNPINHAWHQAFLGSVLGVVIPDLSTVRGKSNIGKALKEQRFTSYESQGSAFSNWSSQIRVQHVHGKVSQS